MLKGFSLILILQPHIAQVFFLKKQAYKKIGLYDKNFRCSADYDLYFRMLKKKYERLFH